MNIQITSLDGGVTKTPSASSIKMTSGSGVVTSRALQASQDVLATTTGAGMANFVDNGGPVLTNVDLLLIFWGSAWAGMATPSAQDVANAVVNILSGPYMSALSQYRGIGQGKLSGAGIFSSFDPPSTFGDPDVINLISQLISGGTVPAPGSDSQLFYCVFMPVGASFGTNSNVIGEHAYFTLSDGSKGHFGWVTNDGTLNSITSIFSHELVEACTDPEGTAIQGMPGTCGQGGGWCEIGDVCEGSNTVVNGVVVQTYWSQNSQGCVI